MKTAIQARKELNSESENLKRFEQLVDDAISSKVNSFRTPIAFSEHELEFIEELGYSISWNRALLEYDVEF